MRSLRGRLTLGVVVVLTVVLGTAGALFSAYAERIAREGLDERLRRTAELSNATAVDAVADQRPESDDRLDAVLGAAATSLRFTLRDTEIFAAGRRLLEGPTPAIGMHTVTQGGERFRVLVVAVPDAGLGDLARLEIASSLRELERRQAELDRRLLLLAAARCCWPRWARSWPPCGCSGRCAGCAWPRHASPARRTSRFASPRRTGRPRSAGWRRPSTRCWRGSAPLRPPVSARSPRHGVSPSTPATSCARR